MEKIKGRDSSDSISYLLSKTNLCLQGWAPRGSSLASLQFCWMLYSHHQVLHLLHLKTDHCRDSLRKKKIKNKNSRHVISKMFLFPKEFQDYNLQAVKAAWIVSGWAQRGWKHRETSKHKQGEKCKGGQWTRDFGRVSQCTSNCRKWPNIK